MVWPVLSVLKIIPGKASKNTLSTSVLPLENPDVTDASRSAEWWTKSINLTQVPEVAEIFGNLLSTLTLRGFDATFSLDPRILFKDIAMYIIPGKIHVTSHTRKQTEHYTTADNRHSQCLRAFHQDIQYAENVRHCNHHRLVQQGKETNSNPGRILNRYPSWLIMLSSRGWIKSYYLLCYVCWFLSPPWSSVRLSFTPSPWHSARWGPFTRRFVKQLLNRILWGLGWLIGSTHSWLKWIRWKTTLVCMRKEHQEPTKHIHKSRKLHGCEGNANVEDLLSMKFSIKFHFLNITPYKICMINTQNILFMLLHSRWNLGIKV